jgi:DNA-binding MarR family transcriptional regulator
MCEAEPAGTRSGEGVEAGLMEEYEEVARARLPAVAPGADVEGFSFAYNLLHMAYLLILDLDSNVHRPRGWTLSGFRLMFKLWVLGPSMPTRLAELSSLNRSAVTNAVHTLEREGLVERLPSPDDGRAQLVALTDKGRAAVQEAFTLQAARESRWLRGVGPDERERLTTMFREIIRDRPVGL